jgi:hypothetical protein
LIRSDRQEQSYGSIARRLVCRDRCAGRAAPMRRLQRGDFLHALQSRSGQIEMFKTASASQ